jgi:hypothetical protein
MLFQKFLQTISGIDPGKIYVENVRSIMNVSTEHARRICEMAVIDNIFERRIGLVCPNDNRILREFSNLVEIPEIITCSLCEANEEEESTFETSKLKKIVYYKMKK